MPTHIHTQPQTRTRTQTERQPQPHTDTDTDTDTQTPHRHGHEIAKILIDYFQRRKQFAHGIFPGPATILQTGPRACRVGHSGIETCLSSWSHEASGPRKGLRGSGARTTAAARCATKVQAPCSTVATSARPCRQKETCTSHRRCERRHVLWVLSTGSSSHTASFRTLRAILPAGFPERQCQVFWHNRPPDGLLEGHIFTDTSSSGCGALRRAGWAVVAVDDVGNLKAAAYGAVPSDVLPGQSARDGEDYAAAMAGHITLDPLTLYTDCEGTIATVSGPKHKALGAQGPRAHVWNRLLNSHDEVKAVKVKGHATERDVRWGALPTCSKGEMTLQTPSPKKGQTYTSLLFGSPRQLLVVRHDGRPTCCSDSGVERHQGCCTTITGTAAASETQAQVERDYCASYRSGVRLAFSHRSLTSLARQSSRPTHVQRAQLAVGTSFQLWGSSFGQRHHLLRQVWNGLLGACGCSLPPLQRIPWGQSVAAAQIEVWPFSQQTLPWLDS